MENSRYIGVIVGTVGGLFFAFVSTGSLGTMMATVQLPVALGMIGYAVGALLEGSAASGKNAVKLQEITDLLAQLRVGLTETPTTAKQEDWISPSTLDNARAMSGVAPAPQQQESTQARSVVEQGSTGAPPSTSAANPTPSGVTPIPRPHHTTVTCLDCGQSNPDHYGFCMKCGKPLKVSVMSAAAGVAYGASDARSSFQGNQKPDAGANEPSAAPVLSTLQFVKCPFCTGEIPAGAKKCKHCGEFVDLTNAASATLSGKLKELPSYYQGQFQKIFESGEQYKGKWNWASFIFGGFWALSKGLWKSGVISLVGSALTFGVVGFIYWFIFGARGNFMYYTKIVKHNDLWI